MVTGQNNEQRGNEETVTIRSSKIQDGEGQAWVGEDTAAYDFTKLWSDPDKPTSPYTLADFLSEDSEPATSEELPPEPVVHEAFSAPPLPEPAVVTGEVMASREADEVETPKTSKLTSRLAVAWAGIRETLPKRSTGTTEEADPATSVEEDPTAYPDIPRKYVAIAAGVTAVVLAGGLWVKYGPDNDKPADEPKKPASTSTHSSKAATSSPKPSKKAAPVDKQLACIAQMPLQDIIGQKIMVSGYADTIDQTAALARTYNLSGVVLQEEVPKADLQNFVEAQAATPLIAVQQEGGVGLNNHLGQTYTDRGALPVPAAVPTDYSLAQAKAIIERDGTYLRSEGVNMVFGPVVLAAPTGGLGELGTMTFDADSETVAKYAGAYVKAYRSAGILPVLDGFPGAGIANETMDDSLMPAENFSALKPRLSAVEDLSSSGSAIAVGQRKVPGLTGGQPAVLSKGAPDWLRAHGYADSVITSGDLSAPAITTQMNESQAIERSFEAGVDIATFSSAPKGESILSVVQDAEALIRSAVANGRLSRDEINKSVERIFALPQKGVDACAEGESGSQSIVFAKPDRSRVLSAQFEHRSQIASLTLRASMVTTTRHDGELS